MSMTYIRNIIIIIIINFIIIHFYSRDHLADPGVDGMIILRCIFRKWDVGTSTGSIWLRIGTLVSAVMNLRLP